MLFVFFYYFPYTRGEKNQKFAIQLIFLYLDAFYKTTESHEN